MKNSPLHSHYILLSFLLLGIEILIALFFHDDFVRPFFGDYLVVILIYCGFQSFFKARYQPVAIGVLLFAYMVEILQGIHILKLLHLKPNLATKLILGSSFSWWDMLCYTLGILTVFIVETFYKSKNFPKKQRWR